MDEVLRELKERGLRPGKIEELLALKEKHPNLQRKSQSWLLARSGGARLAAAARLSGTMARSSVSTCAGLSAAGAGTVVSSPFASSRPSDT